MKEVWESYKKKENFKVLESYYDNSYFNNLRKSAKDKNKVQTEKEYLDKL